MPFYVPNNDEIYCFPEQKTVTKDRQSSLKMTKNVNVTGRNGTTKPTNCMDLTREKAYTINCENAQKLFT